MGDRTKARYVAVAPRAATVEACPEKKESPRSVVVSQLGFVLGAPFFPGPHCT